MLNQICLFIFILKIHIHFGFLFRRGYRLKQKKALPMSYYMIKLESFENAVIIFSEFGEICVGIAPLGIDIFNIDSLFNKMFSLQTIICFITNGSIEYQHKLQLKELSSELEKYLDKITLFMEKDYEKTKPEMEQYIKEKIYQYLDGIFWKNPKSDNANDPLDEH